MPLHQEMKTEKEDQNQTTWASARELTDNELESIIGAYGYGYGEPPSGMAVLDGPGMQHYRPTTINRKPINRKPR